MDPPAHRIPGHPAARQMLQHEYIALLPMEGADSEEGEVYLYRYSETEDGTPNLDNIEDDDEYEIVAEAFDELLDAQEYDELVGEVEEE